MLTVRSSMAAGMSAQLVLLCALSLGGGLGAAAWGTGLGCGVVLAAGVALGVRRAGREGLGPADVVTMTRALLVCVVAALAVESLLHRSPAVALVAVAVVALLLDAVDGWVARRTGTASAFGQRFDGEIDAFLILVLSVDVAASAGTWVLVAGLLRYAFGLAGWILPWMRAQLPFRYWRKVVTATLGIVLTVTAAGVLPQSVTTVGLLGALALVVESFGRDTWWLWRQRPRRGRTGAAVRHTRPAAPAIAEPAAGDGVRR